jgi:tetratricopeptide (TPR) repeat protein
MTIPPTEQQGSHPKIIKANYFIERDDFISARKVIEDSINSGEEHAFLHLALGEVCSALNENLDAKKYYEKSIDASYEDNDAQVRVAAKAGLARIYLQDAIDDFNSLPIIQKIEELENLIPVILNKKLFRALAFEGSPCDCAYTTSNPYDGRKVFGKCRQCMPQL